MSIAELSEAKIGSLEFLGDLLKVVAVANPATQVSTLLTVFVFNPFTARKIVGAEKDTAFVTEEKEVRFTVFDQSGVGSTPVADAPVTFVLGATKGAGLSAISVKNGGTANSQSVMVKTGPDGQAVAFLLGGEMETVKLKGQTPNTLGTIEAEVTIDIK